MALLANKAIHVVCAQSDQLAAADRALIEAWAEPTRSIMQLRLRFYQGSFPALPDDQPRNFLAVVTGDEQNFRDMLPVQFEPRLKRGLSQSFVDDIYSAIRKEGLHLFINALQAAGTYGLFAASRHTPKALLGKERKRTRQPKPEADTTYFPDINQELVELIQEGKRRGAHRVVLGALSKTHGRDRFLADYRYQPGGAYLLPIATGNNLTGVMQAAHIERVIKCQGREPADTMVGIIGATGSVGRRVALRLTGLTNLLLVARRPTELSAFKQELKRRHPGSTIKIGIGDEGIKTAFETCQVVIFLTTDCRVDRSQISANGHNPDIIDAARPRAFPEGEDDGAYVTVPGRHLEPRLMRFPEDQMLPCLAEAIPLLHANHQDDFGIEPYVVPWDDPRSLSRYCDHLISDMAFIEKAAYTAGLRLA